MRLKRLLIENICQFQRLDHAFHPGLTGIIGPNGSGKSNITKAIYFALTGVFRNAGVKADNVAQLGKGKRSCATLWLEHAGISMEIVRGLAGVRTQLRIDDHAEAFYGDTAVTDKVMEILGVDAKLLGEYVFILQLHMTDFIEATPGDRAKVFQRLFGTDECEDVNSFITKVVDKELRVSEQADLPAIRARMAANSGRMDGLVDRLERLDAEVAAYEAREVAARRLIADAEWADHNARELGRLAQQMAAIHEEEQAYAQSRDAAKAELGHLEEALRDVEIDAQNARVKLATWKTVEARRARAATLARRRERLEKEAADNRKPAEVPALTEGEKDELKKLWARHAQLERQIALVTSGRQECPECGQPVVGLSTEEDLRGAIEVVDLKLAGIEEKGSRYQEYVTARDKYDAWLDSYTRAWADLTGEERALDMELEDGPDIDPAALQETVDLEAETRKGIATLQGRHQATSAEAARLRGQLDQIRGRHENLVAEAERRAVAPEALRRARADVERLDSLRLDRGRAEGEADELGRNIDADEALIARLEATEAENAITRTLIDGANQVAAVTHRNAAPRLVSEAHLDRLIDDVDEFLDMFGSDFLVRLGHGLSFVADFVDGRSQAGGRLSEGQKAVLALAFWVAVNFLFAGKIGCLSLDEPTSSLDQQNLGALEVALKQLRELSESAGLQCLLVTHEPSLAPLFDSVLQL